MDISTRDLCVSVSKPRKRIVEDANIHVDEGEFVGLIGPNGSGKSTMLKTIYRTMKRESGDIVLDGRSVDDYPLKESALKLAVVTQHNYFNFDFKVSEVVMMGRTPHKKTMEMDNEEDRRIVEQVLSEVNMTEFADSNFSSLSGGEQQRVILARALAQDTPCLIMDEPTNHLDIKYQLEVLDIVKSLGRTTLCALHDLNLAAEYCDRLYVMQHGHIIAEGTPMEVITERMIEEVYEVRSHVEVNPYTGLLNVVYFPNTHRAVAHDWDSGAEGRRPSDVVRDQTGGDPHITPSSRRGAEPTRRDRGAIVITVIALTAGIMTAVIRDSGTISVSDGTATVRGWVQDIRNLGGISFLTLRDRHGTLQVTMPKKRIDPELFATLTKLPRESVVSVTGEVKQSDQTELGLELIPTSAEVVGEAAVPLPMGVVDKVNVEMDTRLNHRFMDLRKPEVKAIFELKSIMVDLIEEACGEHGFTRVYTPKIGAAGAEGGAELFRVQYFDRPAYLAQSPQLYKQILMSTGLDRVYEIGPAFRAEQSNTNRHVTEFISFDGEMSWIEGQGDVMAVIEDIVDHVLRGLRERGARQLAILGKDIAVPPRPYPVLTYSECLAIAREAGLRLEDGDDLGTEGEKAVGERMAERGNDLYFIAEYPEEAKPFYIMEKEGTPYSYSFDLDYKGQEISSGGQREHRYDALVARMGRKGLDPADFEFYLEAFRYGMPPHGGWGIGIERLLVKALDLPNIREAILFPRDPSRLEP